PEAEPHLVGARPHPTDLSLIFSADENDVFADYGFDRAIRSDKWQIGAPFGAQRPDHAIGGGADDGYGVARSADEDVASDGIDAKLARLAIEWERRRNLPAIAVDEDERRLATHVGQHVD